MLVCVVGSRGSRGIAGVGVRRVCGGAEVASLSVNMNMNMNIDTTDQWTAYSTAGGAASRRLCCDVGGAPAAGGVRRQTGAQTNRGHGG